MGVQNWRRVASRDGGYTIEKGCIIEKGASLNVYGWLNGFWYWARKSKQFVWVQRCVGLQVQQLGGNAVAEYRAILGGIGAQWKCFGICAVVARKYSGQQYHFYHTNTHKINPRSVVEKNLFGRKWCFALPDYRSISITRNHFKHWWSLQSSRVSSWKKTWRSVGKCYPESDHAGWRQRGKKWVSNMQNRVDPRYGNAFKRHSLKLKKKLFWLDGCRLTSPEKKKKNVLVINGSHLYFPTKKTQARNLDLFRRNRNRLEIWICVQTQNHWNEGVCLDAVIK